MKTLLMRLTYITTLLCIFTIFLQADIGIAAPKDKDETIDYEAPPQMSNYEAMPLAQTRSGTRPKVMVLLSNDHTSFYGGYEGHGDYDDSTDYWGYFDPLKIYEYTNGYFYPVAEIDPEAGHHRVGDYSDRWSGNFLNWLTMAHGDFNRKALTGGKRGHDDSNRTRLQRADIPSDGHRWDRAPSDLAAGLSLSDYIPDAAAEYLEGSDNRWMFNEGSLLKLGQGSLGSEAIKYEYNVVVEVCVDDANVSPEENCAIYPGGNMKPEGLLQKYMHEMDFAMMTYSHELATEGGVVRKRMGDIRGEMSKTSGIYNQGVSDSMIRYINSYNEKGWDPLAEMYYDAVRYFKGLSPTSAYLPDGQSDDNFPFFGDHSASSSWNDPYEDWCDDASIVIINDEYPSKEDNYPGELNALGTTVKALTEEVGQMQGIHTNSYLDRHAGTDPCSQFEVISNLGDVAGLCPAPEYPAPGDWGEATGTFHVAGLAHYAYTNDLRGDYEESQNIHTYSVAYRASPSGYLPPADDMNPLYLAAKYGNLSEVESRGAGDPTGISFFPAEKGNDIWDALDTVFQNILRRAGSGTAASVITPSGKGEGSVLQSYFKPVIESGDKEVWWTGYMQSVWMDPCGNLREDTVQDKSLDYSNDKIIEYYYDSSMGTRIRRYSDHNHMPDAGEELVCLSTDDVGYDEDKDQYTIDNLDDVKTIFEAGELLWDDQPGNRTIYTYDETLTGDKKILFTKEQNLGTIEKFLGVNNTSVADPDSLNYLGENEADRAGVLIDYIRGEDMAGLRNRTIEVDGVENTWKLGNIVNSTPIPVAGAVELYHLIYSDASYDQYRREQKNRETMVYVGANDGMLHAFTHGRYDSEQKSFNPVDNTPLGTEIWSYIPQSLLPHLKWLADPNYMHVFYADLKPKIFDAKINGNWGTFLLLGLNKGGKTIFVDDGSPDGRILQPSYTLINITDPRSPKVLWERSYDGSGLTASIPAVFKVGEDWFAAFGSGPHDPSGKGDYKGESYQKSKFFIIDLETGDPSGTADTDWFKELEKDNAFLNSPNTFDKNMNYNVDGIYFGESYFYEQGNEAYWKGNVHKINIPWSLAEGDREYNSDPTGWKHSVLFGEIPGPVTASMRLRTDPDDNVMVFFGTGKYEGLDDAWDEEQQYIFGIKDPFYDISDSTYYQKFDTTKSLTFDSANLFFANPIDVTDRGYVFKNDNLFTDSGEDGIFEEFVAYVRENYDGWYRELDIPDASLDEYGPSERVISEPSLIGGTLLIPSFTPTDDVCGFEGESNVYALYYQTGTGFKRHVLPEEESPTDPNNPIEHLGEEQLVTAIKFKDTVVGAPAAELAFPGKAGSRVPVLLSLSTAELKMFLTEPDRQRSGITGWRDR